MDDFFLNFSQGMCQVPKGFFLQVEFEDLSVFHLSAKIALSRKVTIVS